MRDMIEIQHLAKFGKVAQVIGDAAVIGVEELAQDKNGKQLGYAIAMFGAFGAIGRQNRLFGDVQRFARHRYGRFRRCSSHVELRSPNWMIGSSSEKN